MHLGLRVLAFASYGWFEQVAQVMPSEQGRTEKDEQKKTEKIMNCIPQF